MPSTTRTLAKEKLVRASDNINSAINHLAFIYEKYKDKVPTVEKFVTANMMVLKQLADDLLTFRERFP